MVSSSSLPDMLSRRNRRGISGGAALTTTWLSCSTDMRSSRSFGGPNDALTRGPASNYETDRIQADARAKLAGIHTNIDTEARQLCGSMLCPTLTPVRLTNYDLSRISRAKPPRPP